MAKSRKTSDYVQLDILAAMRGKELLAKGKEETTDSGDIPDKNKLTPYSFVSDILFYKKGNLLDDDENLKHFVPYLVIRWVSLYNAINNYEPSVLYVTNMFDKCCSVLSKKQIYDGLILLIPRQKWKPDCIKYAKMKNEEDPEIVKLCAKHFECSIENVYEFINIFGDDWIEKFKKKFGDML